MGIDSEWLWCLLVRHSAVGVALAKSSTLPRVLFVQAKFLYRHLETEVEDFTANVDFVLSESNALTQISV